MLLQLFLIQYKCIVFFWTTKFVVPYVGIFVFCIISLPLNHTGSLVAYFFLIYSLFFVILVRLLIFFDFTAHFMEPFKSLNSQITVKPVNAAFFRVLEFFFIVWVSTWAVLHEPALCMNHAKDAVHGVYTVAKELEERSNSKTARINEANREEHESLKTAEEFAEAKTNSPAIKKNPEKLAEAEGAVQDKKKRVSKQACRTGNQLQGQQTFHRDKQNIRAVFRRRRKSCC